MRTMVLLFLGFLCFVVTVSAQDIGGHNLSVIEKLPHVDQIPQDYTISRRDQMIGRGGVMIAAGLGLTYFGTRRIFQHVQKREEDDYGILQSSVDFVLGYLGVSLGTVNIIAGIVFLSRGLKMPKEQSINLGFGLGETGQLSVKLTARW